MDLQKFLDTVFGSKDDVINLIIQKNWIKAAAFADHICCRLIINNNNHIWEQLFSALAENNAFSSLKA